MSAGGIRNRQDPDGFEVWHPDGTPYTAADYRRAGLPVPTSEQLAHWAYTARWIAELKAELDTEGE